MRQLLLMLEGGSFGNLAGVDSSHEKQLAAVVKKQEADGCNGSSPGLEEGDSLSKEGDLGHNCTWLPSANVRAKAYPDRWVMRDVQQGCWTWLW